MCFYIRQIECKIAVNYMCSISGAVLITKFQNNKGLQQNYWILASKQNTNEPNHNEALISD